MITNKMNNTKIAPVEVNAPPTAVMIASPPFAYPVGYAPGGGAAPDIRPFVRR